MRKPALYRMRREMLAASAALENGERDAYVAAARRARRIFETERAREQYKISIWRERCARQTQHHAERGE